MGLADEIFAKIAERKPEDTDGCSVVVYSSTHLHISHLGAPTTLAALAGRYFGILCLDAYKNNPSVGLVEVINVMKSIFETELATVLNEKAVEN